MLITSIEMTALMRSMTNTVLCFVSFGSISHVVHSIDSKCHISWLESSSWNLFNTASFQVSNSQPCHKEWNGKQYGHSILGWCGQVTVPWWIKQWRLLTLLFVWHVDACMNNYRQEDDFMPDTIVHLLSFTVWLMQELSLPIKKLHWCCCHLNTHEWKGLLHNGIWRIHNFQMM